MHEHAHPTAIPSQGISIGWACMCMLWGGLGESDDSSPNQRIVNALIRVEPRCFGPIGRHHPHHHPPQSSPSSLGGGPWGGSLGGSPGGIPWGDPLGDTPGGSPGRIPWGIWGDPWGDPLGGSPRGSHRALAKTPIWAGGDASSPIAVVSVSSSSANSQL